MKQQRFAPHGVLALNPQAFGLVFDCHEATSPSLTDEGVAIVAVRGPLMHRADFFFDSYEAIKARVVEALALTPRAVLLSVDSPGGLVSGAFDTARELRRLAAAAGVPLLAHVEGQATSAAYALASAASWIGVSASAAIGSIGIVDTLVDTTAQNAMLGINVQLVTSGARKADGNPNVAISEDAVRASQQRVDTLAGMFFELLVEHGWGSSVDQLRAMQAGIVTGQESVRAQLATAVASFGQAIDFASSTVTSSSGTERTEGKTNMASPMEDAVASLRKAAQSDDEDEAKRARAALAALEVEIDDDEPADEGGQDEESQDEESQDEDMQDDGEDKNDDEESTSASTGASTDAVSMAAQALAKVHKIEVARERERANAERSKLLASRPDFAPELIKVLRKAPIAMVREMCTTLPKGPARKDRVAAAATATGTRGADQGDWRSPRLPANEKAQLDAQMGLVDTRAETVHTPNRMSFGVRRPIGNKTTKEG